MMMPTSGLVAGDVIDGLYAQRLDLSSPVHRVRFIKSGIYGRSDALLRNCAFYGRLDHAEQFPRRFRRFLPLAFEASLGD